MTDARWPASYTDQSLRSLHGHADVPSQAETAARCVALHLYVLHTHTQFKSYISRELGFAGSSLDPE